MSLPIISVPTFQTTLPLSGKKIKYRPFLVKEEKIIILALTESEPGARSAIMMQRSIEVAQNCILTPDVTVADLAVGDFEWLFLKLRMVSKGESLMLEKVCQHCKALTPFKIQLDQVRMSSTNDPKLQMDKDFTVIMKYPVMSAIMETLERSAGDSDKSFDLNVIYDSLDMVVMKEEVYDDFTYEEFETFIDGFSSMMMTKLKGFFEDLPSIELNHKFNCEACEKENEIKLKGSKDFFV